MSHPEALRVLIVDDEAPARDRLRDLLADIADDLPTELVGLAGNGAEALRLLAARPADVVLADIRMPVMDGVKLARELAGFQSPPAVIFTTAFDDYAVQAFELAAVDYLVKPVRAPRLARALGRVARSPLPEAAGMKEHAPARHLVAGARGRILRVPVEDVLYLRAEMKYVMAVTAEAEYLLDASLLQLEQNLGGHFLRIHRNCLVARGAVRGVERARQADGETRWDVVVAGLDERLPVSRRQWPAVRQALGL